LTLEPWQGARPPRLQPRLRLLWWWWGRPPPPLLLRLKRVRLSPQLAEAAPALRAGCSGQ